MGCVGWCLGSLDGVGRRTGPGWAGLGAVGGAGWVGWLGGLVLGWDRWVEWGGIPKCAREQQVNNTFTGVCSRRLRGQTNLESDKHAGKPGAFANCVHVSRARGSW